MINYPPRGLIANLVTPLDERGRPDRMTLARLIQRLTPWVTGFLVGSIRAGEGLDLDFSGRLDLLAAAVMTCGEKSPLLFEITNLTLDDTAKLLERADVLLKDIKSSSTVFYFLTPLAYHGNRDLPQHLRALGQISRRPFVISNNPALAGKLRRRLRHKNIRTLVVKKLSDNEQIVGLEFDGDLTRALNYQRALKLRPGFRFYDGQESYFLERPSSSGLISCGTNLVPQAWANIVASSLNVIDSKQLHSDHLGRIWQSGQAVRSLFTLYQSNPPAFLKAALKMMGLIPRSDVAAAGGGLSRDQYRRLELRLNKVHLI